MTNATVNGSCSLKLDLRGWEQKFAYYYGRWENNLVTAVKRNFKCGAMYDVGASIGLYSVIFGIVCRERGSYVRAFEPVPQNLERLREQLSLNDLDESLVRIEATALGEIEGTLQIRLVDSDRPGNAKIVSGDGVKVPVTTLDHVWYRNQRERVGFLKIDTEGWDARVLAGGRQLIAACRPNLLVEFNRERMRNLQIPIAEVWRFLVGEMQYRSFRIDDYGNQLQIDDPADWENILFVNSVASM